eukprot:1141970-Pelagomonas_calceolata.AAC.4
MGTAMVMTEQVTIREQARRVKGGGGGVNGSDQRKKCWLYFKAALACMLGSGGGDSKPGRRGNLSGERGNPGTEECLMMLEGYCAWYAQGGCAQERDCA